MWMEVRLTQAREFSGDTVTTQHRGPKRHTAG